MWFAAKRSHLHAAIDDAGGHIPGAWFDKQETLYGYYRVAAKTFTDYGIPYAFQTDLRNVFEYKKKGSPSLEKD